MITNMIRRLAVLRGWEKVYCAQCGGWTDPHKH